mmetsp:Transcript_49708/g.58013  ORF Transcript_49708/g.58013 Transcript_49708/m.58013 type:complete len:82 (-) Transcript_49708:172-417(-)
MKTKTHTQTTSNTVSSPVENGPRSNVKVTPRSSHFLLGVPDHPFAPATVDQPKNNKNPSKEDNESTLGSSRDKNIHLLYAV